MKKIIFLFYAFIISSSLFSQAPQGINYQGVLRDPGGAAISNQNISLELKIWQGNPLGGGSLIYSEIHTAFPTDTFGLYTVVIGSTSGSGIGSFNSIPWSAGNMWVEVYADPIGGTSFSLIAQQQLMSVPYALYAQTSGSGGGGSISGQSNNIPRINNTGNGLGKSLIFQSTDSSSVGINISIPNADAVLDIVSSAKGLLIPRMTDAQRMAIPASSANHGMLVYQINNAGLISPQGFWYYDAVSSNWLLLAPAQAVWTLGGNALGANSFLGSLDNQDIVFKTGFITATERMRIFNNTKGGNVQFGLAPNEFIFPAAKGNPGDVLQLDPVGTTNNLLWVPMTGSGSSPWIRNGGNIFTTNTTDTVGIGTNSPQASLEILSNNSNGAFWSENANVAGAAGTFTLSNPSSGNVALDIGTAGSGNAVNATAVGGYALSGVSQGGVALWTQNSSSGASTIEAENTGGHSAGYFHNNVIGVGTAPTLYVTNADPAMFSAQFSGGLGITTDGIQVTAGSIAVGNVLTSDASGFGTWQPAGVGPWTLNGNLLFPTNLSDTIGIGTATPKSTLDIFSINSRSALNVANVSAGGAGGVFSLSNSANDSTALVAFTKGGGNAFLAITQGNGNAGAFGILNSLSTGSGIIASTNGNGKAVLGINYGKGYGGAFILTNPLNDSAAVAGSTLGNGPAVLGYNTGMGNGGFFQITKPGNTHGAIDAITNGAGSAGNFLINNSTNSSAVLNAVTNGTGFSGDFSGGAGLRTDKIRIFGGAQTGLMLVSTTAIGDAQWAPVPGSINFGIPVSSTLQTFSLSTNNVVVNLGTAGYANPPVCLSGNSFVAPSAGLYHFNVQLTISNATPLAGGNITLSLYDPTAGSVYKQIQYQVPAGGTFNQPIAISTDIILSTGQKVVLTISNNSTATNYQTNTNPTLSWFNGHKVY